MRQVGRLRPVRTVDFLLVGGLVVAGCFFMGWGLAGKASGNGGQSSAVVEAVLSPDGGKIVLPGNEVILLYPQGAVDRPVRIRVEKVRPEDLPGPVPEGVVVIEAVHLTHPELDYSQPYAGVYKHNPLQILFRWKGYVEDLGPSGRYYTAVCQWDDYEGHGTFGVVRWGCTFADPRRVVEYGGTRYFLTSAFVIPPENSGLGYHVLVQFPKELSRRNCEAKGGVFSEWAGRPFCSGANGQGSFLNDMAEWVPPPDSDSGR